ncbi:DUF2147 domain-containing protein [Roseateles albus]|uniref:DUF2147 domain-containing protein n=1 Tax=Roseateles albus TaxID=2987525 RepID=A0ABT5KCF5_9BURK|nr:DUF2147 domain-containing protein [Roseateles albus]MDC8771621.1 DUF2147 domain-containing protein [Roseateles albus]
MKSLIAAAVLSLVANLAVAQATPAGLWKTFDDDGKTEKSLVRVSEVGGVYQGKIEKIFDPARQNAKCDKCEGERKDQPILGMVIFHGAKQDDDDKSVWNGSEIVKPDEGKVYKKMRIQLAEGGKTLKVRGYIGFLFQTREWVRVE